MFEALIPLAYLTPYLMIVAALVLLPSGTYPTFDTIEDDA